MLIYIKKFMCFLQINLTLFKYSLIILLQLLNKLFKNVFIIYYLKKCFYYIIF